MGLMVNATSCRFIPGKNSGTHWRKQGGPRGRSGRFSAKRKPLAPTDDQTPDRLFGNRWLYRRVPSASNVPCVSSLEKKIFSPL